MMRRLGQRRATRRFRGIPDETSRRSDARDRGWHLARYDGVFVRDPDGTLCFHAAAPPTGEDVARVVAWVRRRLERLGLVGVTVAGEDADPLADE